MNIKKKIIVFATALLCTACSSTPKVKPIEATLPETKIVEFGDDLATRVSTDLSVSVSYVIKDTEGLDVEYNHDDIELLRDYRIVYILTRGEEIKILREIIQFEDTTSPTIEFRGKDQTIILSSLINYDTIYDEICSYFEITDNYEVPVDSLEVDIEEIAKLAPGNSIETEVFVRDNGDCNCYNTRAMWMFIVAPEKK